ncbi:MAG: hypothetical protein Q4C70_03805 [Planctomycetia bacterium]|nr:hypothetical protein [Planctomycetia bacterium]
MSKMNQEPSKNSSWVLWMIFVPLLLAGALIVTCMKSDFHGYMWIGVLTLVLLPIMFALASWFANQDYENSEEEKNDFQKKTLKIGKHVTSATLLVSCLPALSFVLMITLNSTFLIHNYGEIFVKILFFTICGFGTLQFLYGIFNWITLRHSAYRNTFWSHLWIVAIYGFTLWGVIQATLAI